MKPIREYCDSTYLKTPSQSGLTEEKTREIVVNLAKEAMAYGFYAVMIRPDYVREVKDLISTNNADVKVGTVIGFPEGTGTTESKLREAEKAIGDGADELDFVANFEAFKHGDLDLVKKEIEEGTNLGLINGKVVKWIIEIAALTDEQIAGITKLISDLVEEKFPGKTQSVFVKSSTGFYKTTDGKPSGATVDGIRIMLQNAGHLPVKAAGGVKTPEQAKKMIEMGVQRIGTSSAKTLIGLQPASNGQNGY